MEQRTILAIVLSLMVLFVYSSLTQNNAKKTANISQIYGNNMVTSNNIPERRVEELTKSLPPSPSLKENLEEINSQELKVEFSDLGGSIKKVTIKKYDHSLPIANMLNVSGFENQKFEVTDKGINWIEYSLNEGQLTIKKRYTLPEHDYIINAKITINNIPNMSKLNDLTIIGLMLDMSSLDKNKVVAEGTLYEYSASTNYAQIYRKANALKFSSKEAKSEVGIVNWIGFRNRYFCAVIKPLFKVEHYSVNPLSETQLKIDFPGLVLNSGINQNSAFDFLIFVGPQDLNLLKNYKSGIDEIMSFSNIGIFDISAKIIYNLMTIINNIIHNWGICIILISLIIYGALYPLTIMGMSSMKRMQLLQPQIAKLREQHKSNPQKLNKEVMELYKTNKVNPFGGCLPFIFQMPIFIGLYQVLWRSIFLKGSGFLWIKDLAEPDRLFTFPFNIPFLGNELNILPILMAIVMFFQQKVTQKSMVVVDPDQATQQKIMAIFLPIFLGFVFYRFASGLSLYFTIFYSLSTLTQIKMSKMTVIK